MACFDVAVIADAGFYMSPLKLLEYMAAGKAVVAPAYDAIAEVVSDGQDGLLFPSGRRRRPHCGRDSARGKSAREAASRDSAAAEKIRSQLTWTHNAAKVVAACADVAAETARRARLTRGIRRRREALSGRRRLEREVSVRRPRCGARARS
jgi:glycosyltransferase involved in cell wall biosynthesis